MAFYSSSNTNQTNLSVVGSTSSASVNHLHAVPSTVYHRQELGPVTASIRPIVLAAPCISMTPSTVAQTYYLPTAAQILQVFGRNLESGQSHFCAGTIMELQFVNRSALFPCRVSSAATGGDAKTIECPVYSGTKIFLEFTSVSSGLNGCTGDYIIYPVSCYTGGQRG
jgi:hypothetical protein